jgi:hypothetical protein
MIAELTKIDNHSTIARSHLLTQDSNRDHLGGLLNAIIQPLQDIENSLFELYKNRSLNYAAGFYLDGIGAIIGEARNYRNDHDYRFAILIRIISNNGGGTAAEILIILASIYSNSDIQYTECASTLFQIQIKQEARPSGINQLLSKLKPIGVSVPIVAHLGIANNFQFAESTKEEGILMLATKDVSQAANINTGDKFNITFGTFATPSNAVAFAEIIVNRSNLNLHDGREYLLNKKQTLQLLKSYQDYTIQGGGVFSELITNE